TTALGVALGVSIYRPLPCPSCRGEAAIASHGGHEKHAILFLAANPPGTPPLLLDREVRSIHAELQRSGYRDRFDFVTRWAAEPLDLLRELRELKPTAVHSSGHGAAAVSGASGWQTSGTSACPPRRTTNPMLRCTPRGSETRARCTVIGSRWVA